MHITYDTYLQIKSRLETIHGTWKTVFHITMVYSETAVLGAP